MSKVTTHDLVNNIQLNNLLLSAAKNGDKDAVQRLLEAQADPNAKEGIEGHYYGATPLYYASKLGHADIVQLLLDAGANPNAKGHAEQTPLQVAAEHNQTKVVELLLEKGVDLQASGNTLSTNPLHAAIDNGNPAIVGMLVKAFLDTGAELNMPVKIPRYPSNPFDHKEPWPKDLEFPDPLSHAMYYIENPRNPDDEFYRKLYSDNYKVILNILETTSNNISSAEAHLNENAGNINLAETDMPMDTSAEERAAPIEREAQADADLGVIGSLWDYCTIS